MSHVCCGDNTGASCCNGPPGPATIKLFLWDFGKLDGSDLNTLQRPVKNLGRPQPGTHPVCRATRSRQTHTLSHPHQTSECVDTETSRQALRSELPSGHVIWGADTANTKTRNGADWKHAGGVQHLSAPEDHHLHQSIVLPLVAPSGTDPMGWTSPRDQRSAAAADGEPTHPS